MKKLLLPIALLALTLSACVKDKGPHSDSALIGLWVSTDYQNNLVIYDKENSFNAELPGIEFKADGTVVKRQVSGFCATPPVHYEEVSGTWSEGPDGTVTITYDYWGGSAEEDWRIDSVDGNELHVETLDFRANP